MTVDINSIFSQAEVVDDEDLIAARQVSGLPGKLVEGFNERGEDRLVVTAEQLDASSPRRVKQNGTLTEAPHDLKSLRNLAGAARKFARENGLEVNAKVVKVRGGGLAIRFTHEEPDYVEGRGPQGSRTVADEVE